MSTKAVSIRYVIHADALEPKAAMTLPRAVFNLRIAGVRRRFRLPRALPELTATPYGSAVSSRFSSPSPLARSRSVAAPPRAPERHAAELAAGVSPVTKWSRALAR